MAGQRPLADDHTCTGWQPLTHATLILAHAWCRQSKFQASGHNIFSVGHLPPSHVAVIPMQVLLLCLYFIIEEHLELEEGQKSVPPTGICLSPLFIVAAVTDGQNITVLMLAVASPSSVSWRYLIYLLPCDKFVHASCHYSGTMLKCFWLAIIPTLCSVIDSSLPVRHVYIYWCKLIPLPACTELLSTWHLFSQYLNRAVTLALDYWHTAPYTTQYLHPWTSIIELC